MPSYNTGAELGSFVSTTQTQNIPQTINQMSLVLNTKDTGYYPLTEFVCGQLYFPDPTLTSASTTTPVWRQVFRKVINFGALPNTATKTVAHGITMTATTTFTRIYGCASIPGTTFVPLPLCSTTALANNISLYADATNVIIATGVDRTAYTTCYVVLEWLKF